MCVRGRKRIRKAWEKEVLAAWKKNERSSSYDAVFAYICKMSKC